MKDKLVRFMVATIVAIGLPIVGFAADHGDAPLASLDRSADLGDTYVFLDPNDNTKLVLAMTTQGFIVPGEAVNFSIFDHNLVFVFELETTGDAAPDQTIQVTFTEKQESSTNPQMATITLPGGGTFAALTTVSNLSNTSPEPVITTDAASGVAFFAGGVDDPFFFDVPGFSGFVASVLAGSADPGQLARGRDTFAGYNTLAIVLSIPVSLLGEPTNGVVGVNSLSQRTLGEEVANRDRAGLPTVNTVLIPFARKNEFNQASTQDDAAGLFADDIIASLRALGTNEENIGLLAQVAVTQGDFLRIDLVVSNTGPGGGNNPEAAFPNGRRLIDDVIDTILSIVTNGAITTGDSVNGNELPFRDTFPFLPPTHQPIPVSDTVDDLTRN